MVVKESTLNSPFRIKKYKSWIDKLFGTFDLFRQLSDCQLVKDSHCFPLSQSNFLEINSKITRKEFIEPF